MQHMLAGAVAGMAEHSAMYPVDTIKTRMQALGHPGQQVRPIPSLPFAAKAARLHAYGRAASILPAAAAAPSPWKAALLAPAAVYTQALACVHSRPPPISSRTAQQAAPLSRMLQELREPTRTA